MNILIYFGNQINPLSGGTERVATLLSEYLRKIGHSIFFLACHRAFGDSSVESSFLPDGVELPTTNNIEFVNNFLSENRIDVIINEGGYGDSIYLFSHEFIPKNIKIISHIHFDPMGGNKSFYKTLNYPLVDVDTRTFTSNLLRWCKAPYNRNRFLRDKKKRFHKLIETSDKIVLLKESHARDFKKISGTDDSSKLVVLRNPITFNVHPITCSEKTNSILFVGRLDYSSKRIDRILKVWELLQSKYVDWNLIIVGDGPDKNRLENICQKKGLKRVIFTGKTDASSYYQKAKLLLITSNYEGCPMVIPEAMAYGVVPLVMNTFSGADDMIVDGYNGMLTKPFNIKDMVHRIESLITNPSYLSYVSENAMSTISHIDNEVILKEWASLIS